MKSSIKSFTLVELLVVIAILAVLAIGLVIAINPGEMIAQARDSNRLRDLNSINRALSLIQVETPTAFLGDPTRIYLSLPSTSPICNTTVQGLTYTCVSEANLRLSDGSGWLPVNVGHIISVLPLDPRNSLDTGSYYAYIFQQGKWKLTALLESDRSSVQMARDGGSDVALFEVGPDLSIANFHRGLVGHWSFDNTAEDLSGLGNHGTLMNGPTYVTGLIGNALSFDGVDDFVSAGNNAVLRTPAGTTFTYIAWIRGLPEILPNQMFFNRWLPYFRVINGRLHLSVSAAGSQQNVYGNTSLSLNSWHHVAATFDEVGMMRVFLNGLLDGTAGPFLPIVNNGDTMRFGVHANSPTINCCPYSGLLDDARVYNRALSEFEIRAIFNATRSR